MRLIRLQWEPSEEDDKNSHAAIFEVKFGKKKQKEQSPIRASEKPIRFSVTRSLLHMPLKAVTSTLLRTISCLRQSA